MAYNDVRPSAWPVRLAVASLCAIALFAAACGSDGGSDASVEAEPQTVATVPPTTGAPQTAPAAGATDSEPTAELTETRDAVLQLAVPLVDGSTFDPQSVAGKDVLLWFWAPW